LSTVELIRTLEGHARGLTCLAFSPDGKLLVTGSADGKVILWDVQTGAMLNTLIGYEGEAFPVSGVAFSPDGKILATGTTFDAKLWDMAELP